MTSRQKARHRLARRIYEHLRAIDSAERGSRAFNWFESTGHGGAEAARWAHSMRIWKFVPRSYELDDGWTKRNLDKQGRYLGPIKGTVDAE